MDVVAHWNHWVVIVLMMTGFYVLMAKSNLVKKMLGLNVLQASVILMYVTMGKVEGGTAAILLEPPVHVAPGEHDGAHDAPDAHGEVAHTAMDHHTEPPPAPGHAPQATATVVYSNPVPHVLMLTAIVVGVATTAVGLALVVRIQEAYGTVEEDEILLLDEGEA